MKILNAIHAQNIGGVDQVFRDYTEVLTAAGHDVALMISDNGRDNYPAKKIFKLQNRSQVLDFLHLLFIAYSFRPDVILCHSNRIMKWMRILKFLSGAKSVAINHGISFKNSLHCKYIVSINQQISDMVVAAGHDASKSFILSNVIKVDQKYRQKILKKPAVIGIYGRLEPRKGFDILFTAAEILQKNGHDFRLKVGGLEVHRNYGWREINNFAAEYKISQKCQMVGTVLDKEKFFEDVDIFCVPSREEPFGLVILEGFLFSTLVISSNSDGGKLLIKNGEDGLLFENGNAENLAAKIEQVLQNPEIYPSLTSRAFSKLEKEFSFDSLNRDLNKILEKISQNPC